ncbi:MAG: hypothetical protein AB7N69_01505 [Immundisolibacter sp.]|uniref:hypothetical protein n=1 Tax=Immundisolibacter sp. TaxID=1934948 RepID=UPI003D11E858
MSGKITIGAELGDPESKGKSDLKIILVRLFDKHVTATHCSAIDQYALVLRIDGKFGQFGEEGLARLRFQKSRRYISVDIQIPEHVWKPMTIAEFGVYLVQRVREALYACVERLEHSRAQVDRELLFAQVAAATREFAASDG